jgi:lipoprotein-anchoring transpeptidase ErfK/SrfK
MRTRRVLHVVTVVAVLAGLISLLAPRGSSAGTAPRNLESAAIARPLDATPPAPADPVTTALPVTAPSATDPAVPATAIPVTTTTVAPTPVVSVPETSSEPATTSAAKTLVAHLVAPLVQVYAHPSDTRSTAALHPSTEFGNVRALPVVARAPEWLEVLLPIRPNSSTGWIRASDAQLGYVYDEIAVDLATRTLVWTRSGDVMLTTTVGIGAVASPTPTGAFFLTDILARDPGGSYGAWILALDGHSETFSEFDGGDARIAIHGTDDPSSIGAAVSSGCVRIPSGSLAQLAASLPLGTPVVIR